MQAKGRESRRVPAKTRVDIMPREVNEVIENTQIKEIQRNRA